MLRHAERLRGSLRARDYADEKSREAEKRGITVAKMTPATQGVGETCDDWHDRYVADRKAAGQTDTRNKAYRWSKWIAPTIGDKAMAAVSKDDVEDIRDALDLAIREARIKWKTATNVWGELTASCDEACNSKNRALRIVQADPTRGVRPPERGGATSKVYPYPSEALAVFCCEKIPREWRELRAVAAYTYLRPGELHVLTWNDVDLEDQKISVNKAWDYDAKRIRSTKTWETREVPIEPNLLRSLNG